MENNVFIRNCPQCGEELEYKSEASFRCATRKNYICRGCAEDGRRKKISKGLVVAYAEGRRKRDVSDEVREKISNTLLGNIPWNKGLTKDIDDRLDFGRTKEYIKYKCKNDECNNYLECMPSRIGYKKYCDECWNKVKNGDSGILMPWNKGLTKNDDPRLEQTRESIKRIRLTTLRNIENRVGQVMPNYNSKALSIIERKANELGINDLQHAENGGEFQVCGYFVDGYSPSKNVVIEYYEPFHKRQKEKDKMRKNEIINHLKCDFIEIKEWENN